MIEYVVYVKGKRMVMSETEYRRRYPESAHDQIITDDNQDRKSGKSS